MSACDNRLDGIPQTSPRDSGASLLTRAFWHLRDMCVASNCVKVPRTFRISRRLGSANTIPHRISPLASGTVNSSWSQWLFCNNALAASTSSRKLTFGRRGRLSARWSTRLFAFRIYCLSNISIKIQVSSKLYSINIHYECCTTNHI